MWAVQKIRTKQQSKNSASGDQAAGEARAGGCAGAGLTLDVSDTTAPMVNDLIWVPDKEKVRRRTTGRQQK